MTVEQRSWQAKRGISMPDPTAPAVHVVRDRVDALKRAMQREKLAAFVSVAPPNQAYLTAFRALLYSRPLLLVVGPERTVLIVPGLEEDHARSDAIVDEVQAYYEHPRAARPVLSHLDLLDDLRGVVGPGARIGVEFPACPAGLARHLSDAGFALVDLSPVISTMRSVKDGVELAAIADAARLVTTGVTGSVAACRVGITEIEVDGAGTTAVLQAVGDLQDADTVDQLVMTPSGPERSVLPHAFSTTRRLKHGDVLIHTRQVALNGYRAELERTAFVGSPDADRRRLFDTMRTAQEAARNAVRSGAPCSSVDRAAREVFRREGLDSYAIHRSGHGIGLSPHEPPYLRFDNDEPLEEGMVVTVEPGIYVPSMGGFRHSDTLVVTPTGSELLTSYATDVESLTRE
jgi:Xaa-Pro dipeptidase